MGNFLDSQTCKIPRPMMDSAFHGDCGWVCDNGSKFKCRGEEENQDGMIQEEGIAWETSGLFLAKEHHTECQFVLLSSGNIIATLQNVPSSFLPSVLPFFLPPFPPFLAIFTVGNKQKEPFRDGFSVTLRKIYPQGPALIFLSPLKYFFSFPYSETGPSKMGGVTD